MRSLIRHFCILALVMLLAPSLLLASDGVKIIFTSDVHGSVFPYNFVDRHKTRNSLSQVYAYVKAQRATSPDLLLFDDGDMLQGQPAVYYYNFVDTLAPHLQSEVMNFMGYNASTVGNHDLETGHPVYDRVRSQSHFPWLAANAVKNDGGTYFEPYKVFTVNGKKIAVIGLITPAIPTWLPENIWSGMHFDDMIESAQKWIDIVRTKEKPDAIVGLFHAGANYEYGNQKADTYKNENASVLVAQRVKGFDAVLMGHDHQALSKKIANNFGDSVLLLNPGAGARNVCEMTIEFSKDKKSTQGKVVSMAKINPDPEFDAKFAPYYNKIEEYTSKKIGALNQTISSQDAFFGSSAFVDLVHRFMLKDSKADISFASPLLFNTSIKAGDIFVGDMFKLYKYENLYYVLELTGKEVLGCLEYSYNMWLKPFSKDGKGMIRMSDDGKLEKQYYNFDSAAGINYTVDITKPFGKRVTILSMANGAPFDTKKTYKVAMTSYRGNGGGGHLAYGAKIAPENIVKRMVYSSDYDLRLLIMRDIESTGVLSATPLNNWKFVPEDAVAKARKTDEHKLFSGDSAH